MVTISEVAKKANVSRATISHVLNNTRYVAEETRQRVEEAIKELGYRPNVLDRSLRLGQTHTLGLILPDSSNTFFLKSGAVLKSRFLKRATTSFFVIVMKTLKKKNSI